MINLCCCCVVFIDVYDVVWLFPHQDGFGFFLKKKKKKKDGFGFEKLLIVNHHTQRAFAIKDITTYLPLNSSLIRCLPLLKM